MTSAAAFGTRSGLGMTAISLAGYSELWRLDCGCWLDVARYGLVSKLGAIGSVCDLTSYRLIIRATCAAPMQSASCANSSRDSSSARQRARRAAITRVNSGG